MWLNSLWQLQGRLSLDSMLFCPILHFQLHNKFYFSLGFSSNSVFFLPQVGLSIIFPSIASWRKPSHLRICQTYQTFNAESCLNTLLVSLTHITGYFPLFTSFALSTTRVRPIPRFTDTSDTDTFGLLRYRYRVPIPILGVIRRQQQMTDANVCVGMCVVHVLVSGRHQQHRTVCNHLEHLLSPVINIHQCSFISVITSHVYQKHYSVNSVTRVVK